MELSDQIIFKCPGCGVKRTHVINVERRPRPLVRQNENDQTPETLERLNGIRCIECDAIIVDPAPLCRPAWCQACGGHPAIANRRALRLEKPKQLSLIDSIMSGGFDSDELD